MKNNVVYVYVNESNLDCSGEVEVFEKKEDAKAKVASMFDLYVNSTEYLSTPESKEEARKDYEMNEHESFTIQLGNGYDDDDEKLNFRVEKHWIH